MSAVEKRITARLSLRYPQHEALNVLVQILDNIKLSKNTDLIADLEAIKSLYPSVQNFERDFPSFCFALSNGSWENTFDGRFYKLSLFNRPQSSFFLSAKFDYL
ncbi:hypothetical protein ACRPOS_003615 [Bartonella heixiaziensis]|uniref:hypothetical protein n=1 Tax=Bartonella heixiaziensis TaxID=1461000 RepID=UPI0039088D1B